MVLNNVDLQHRRASSSSSFATVATATTSSRGWGPTVRRIANNNGGIGHGHGAGAAIIAAPPPPRRRRVLRRRTTDPSRRAFVVAILLLCFAVIAILSFLVIRRIAGSSGSGEDGGGLGSSSSRRFVQKWKGRRNTVDGRRAAAAAVDNPASVPAVVEEDPGAEDRARAREDGYRSLYVPKYGPSVLGYDVRNCPPSPPPGYPMAWKASEVLGDWPPGDILVPVVPTATTSTSSREERQQRRYVHQGLCVFEYDAQLDVARAYRNAELPFVLRGDPTVAKVARRWSGDIEYLHRRLGDDVEHRVERSPNVNFMWYRLRGPGGKGRGKGRGHNMPPPVAEDFVPPPNDEVEMTFGEWLERAMDREGEALGDGDMIAKASSLRERRMSRKMVEEGGGGGDVPLDDDEVAAGRDGDGGGESEEAKRSNYYYFRLNANLLEVGDGGSSASEFLYDELPFLDPRKVESEFYIVDKKEQRGINCRFGMRGVTAANHFDMSRNTISVLGGERRYVLARPDQCSRMSLHPRGHPSVRHSSFDWGDPVERKKRPDFEDAMLTEVVLHEGDVLYLPTNWFHYIVNLSLNYQCNARSGTTFETADVVGACGFKMDPGDFRMQ